MKLSRKEITLPSGGTCIIRKLSPLDLTGLKVLPQAFPQESKTGTKKVAEKDAVEYGLAVTRAILSKCVGKISVKDGERMALIRIVDKPFDDCGTNELSIEEVEQSDADFIVKEVLELSSMNKEAGQLAEPFPQE